MPEQLKPGAFRLWNEKEKCYIDTDKDSGFSIDPDGDLWWRGYKDERCGCCSERVEDVVTGFYQVERWTGRKNLYEGDVVPWSAILHEIVWFNGGFALKLLGEDTNICCEIFGLDDSELPDAIGTIHDSPEALAAAAKAVSQ